MSTSFHHQAPVISILLLSCAIIGGLFFFDLFSLPIILLLSLTVVVVLTAGEQLWLGALAIPLAIPIGVVTTVLVNQSYRYEMTAVEFLLLIFSVALAYALVWRVIELPSSHTIEIVMMAWLALAYASLLWIVDGQKYLVAVRVFTYHFLAFMIAVSLFSHKRARDWAMRVVVASAGVMALQLIQTLAGLGSVNKILVDRSSIVTAVGPLATVVAILVLLLPFVVIQGYRTTGIGRWVSWAVAALAGMTVVASIGKAAILIMVASLGYLFTHLGKGTVFIKRTLVIVAIALVLGGSVSNIPGLIVERFTAITSGATSQGRIEEARTGLLVFRRNIIHGVGAGNLKYYYQRLLNGYNAESNVLLVQVAAEYGLIGLALLGLLVFEIRKVVRSLNDRVVGHRDRLLLVGVRSSIVAMVLYSVFEVTFVALSYGILFWWLIGLLVAWEHSLKNSQENSFRKMEMGNGQ